MEGTEILTRYIDIYQNPERDASEKEIALIKGNNERYRRLYLAIRQILIEQFDFDGLTDEEREKNVPVRPERHIPADPKDFPGTLGDEIRDAFVSIYGLMITENYIDPSMGRYGEAGPQDLLIKDPPDTYVSSVESNGTASTGNFRADRRFIEKVVDAVKAFNANRELFQTVFEVIIEEATKITPTHTGDEREVKARQGAEIARRLLVQNEFDPKDPQIKRIIKDALSQSLGGMIQGRTALIDINLPDLDLDTGSTSDIIGDNVKALSAVYFTAMLEEMRYFMVADKIVEQFMSGMLPISRGPGGENIYKYIRNAINRFTEAERRALYARTFGLAQGSVEVDIPNREFQDLWIRFLSAVSLTGRQVKQERQLIHPQQVHKNARDLSVNLSLHGYSVSHFFAVELQKLVNDVNEMLNHEEIINAYGVRNQWQLVERITQLHFGTTVNTLRYRTMAQAGSKIILWLANQAPVIASPFVSSDPLFNPDNPDFIVLQDYVERWLAVTGTTDQTVEKYSEPVMTNTQTTIPQLSLASIPDVQNVLEQAGKLTTPEVPTI